MSINPSKPINATNELAKERNRAAAERTLLAWIRRCLSLITFGVALDQIDTAIEQGFFQSIASLSNQFTETVSLVFVSLGVVLMIVGMLQTYFMIKAIEREDYIKSAVRPLNFLITIAILIFGIFSFLAVLIRYF